LAAFIGDKHPGLAEAERFNAPSGQLIFREALENPNLDQWSLEAAMPLSWLGFRNGCFFRACLGPHNVKYLNYWMVCDVVVDSLCSIR